MVVEQARQSALPQNHSGEYKAKVHIMLWSRISPYESN